MNGNHEASILGRALVFGEGTQVPGAKSTLPPQDHLSPCLEPYVGCVQGAIDSGALADNNICTIPIHISGT